jgi:ATP-dependent Clp protease protease subunit
MPKEKKSKRKKKEEIPSLALPQESNPIELLDEERFLIINNIEQPSMDGSGLVRNIALYGDLTEDSASDIVQSFMYLKELSSRMPEEECQPIEFLISSHGGAAAEMFAIYDTMRMVRESCDISTVGMGKVMSAGVVLLAAGTKGKRKIGSNCRVMIHSVNGGYHGNLSNMENEIAEVRWVQDRYVESLSAETEMSKREIRKYLKKHVDVYLSAEEAVELGIADIIV